MASGKMIRQMVTGSIRTLMELNMKGSGKMICSMDRASKHGQMDPVMKDIIKKAKSMEEGRTFGPTVPNMWVTGSTIRSMDKVSTLGSTVDPTRAHGKTITCTAMELTPGVMEENMKASITWIRSTVTVFITGPMVAVTKATGKMGSSMERENTFYPTESPRSAFGRMGNASSGSIK